MAYAKRVFGGQGDCKKAIALDCGYSPNVANSVSSHIENKPGFNNAMSALAIDSNNLALSAMHEFKSRGFTDFSNKELVAALNAIGSAWAKFNNPISRKPNSDNPHNNKLRTVILQQVENQVIAADGTQSKEQPTQFVEVSSTPSPPPPPPPSPPPPSDPLEF